MPFVSKAQDRWGNSPAGKKALGGADAVAEWNGSTNFGNLPNKSPKASIRHVGAITRARKKVHGNFGVTHAG